MRAASIQFSQTSRSFTRQTEPNFAQTHPAQLVPPLHLSTTSETDRHKQLTRPNTTGRAVMVMAVMSLDDIAPVANRTVGLRNG
ncbi:hypothetical protein BLNAU_22999 [Blattamonas nauphoetae]|uniref:Uncharacterized protein n=1 Tax=Blattamonas nauphoetae TaxID=2049346 RepID=A0ABQ9WTN3_9EUKA|nr:hypothetical protein BLNAU_22999 [Blattamonas nauphoetae]